MSHLSTIEVQFNDLDAIDAACNELGLKLNRNDTNCVSPWFKHTCDHTITVPTVEGMNVGLFKTEDGKAWKLGYDSMYREISKALGGERAQRFTQLYAVHKATIEARKRGYMVTRQVGKGGNINVVVSGY